jgi:hypothetical protein
VSDGEVFPVPEAWAKNALMGAADYEAAVRRVALDPDGYWTDVAKRLDWMTPFTEVKDVSFDAKDFRVRWYADGVLNVSVNCIDRTCLSARTRPRSSGRATTARSPTGSATASCTPKSAAWPMC